MAQASSAASLPGGVCVRAAEQRSGDNAEEKRERGGRGGGPRQDAENGSCGKRLISE